MKKRVLAIILVMSMVFGMMIPSYGTSVGGAESDDASAGVSDPVEESGEPTKEPPTETAPGEDEPPTESVLGEEDEPPTESVLGEEDVPSPDGEVDMSTSFLDTVDTINDKMKMQARAIPGNIYDEPAVQYDITYNTRQGNNSATGAWQDPVQTMDEALRRMQQRYNAGTKSFKLRMYDYDVSMISWPDGNYRWLLQSMVMDPNVVLIIETNTNIDFPTWFEGADKIACKYFVLKSGMTIPISVTARAGTRWAVEIAPGSTVLLRGVKITGGAVSDALVKVDSNSTTGVGATLNVGPTEYGNNPTELVGRSSLPVCIDNYGGTVNIGGASITGSPIGVKVDNGTLNMAGGTISGNTTGIHVQRASTVDITGGTISNNTTGISSLAGDNSICYYTVSGSANISNNTGDGMTLSSTGVVVMNGGTINNNGGAGVNIGGFSRFDMNGGTMNGNNYGLITSTSHTYGSVIAGGTISGSRTDGVSVRGGKCFIKNNIVIESNTNSGVNITGGTLSITGGTIRGNNVRVAGGTVTMSGGTITGAGDGVVVASNTTFTLSGGNINGNSSGAWVNGGTFNMTGGTIANNNRSGNKRGIHVGSGGRFTMSGSSTISGNEGSGVYIDGNSTVTIQAGTIRGNGQGVNLSSGTFNMENGTISGNTGHGISVSGGNFNMSGGAISNNPGDGVSFAGNGTFTMSGNASITGSANGANVASGTFNMNGGTITGAIHDGVVVASNATFTMRGGSINGNNTGAWVNGGTFNMNGGTIADNNSGSNKRGIYVGSGGRFTMSGNSSVSGHEDCGIGVYENATATISGSATISNNANGGIDFTTGASLTLSGSPSIIDNTRNGQPSNISLGSNKTITVTGVLSNSDPIGISVPTNSGNTIFANCDSSDAARSNMPKFRDDSNTRSVRNSSSNLILSNIDTRMIFVKSDGQDTNSGTRDNPFATIQKALQEVAEGGIIYVMDNITEASSNLENAKSVTITTDPTRDSLCTIPEGENAVVTLNFPANSTHFIRQVNNATLTLQNITLQGDGTSTVSDSVLTIGAFNNADGIQGHIVLDNGATLQDFKTGIGAIGTTDSERSDCNVTVTIKAGAKIINNQVTVGTKQDVAGGISIWGLGALKMEGGEISNNTGPSGGIFIHKNPGTACQFPNHEITGGSITGNQSTGTGTGRFYAGGVFIRNNAQLTISNTTITGNTAAGGDNSAGGVYIKDDTNALTLSGQVTINNNTKGGNASNISLPSSNSSITLGSSITGSVGVTQVGAAPQVVFATSSDASWATNSAGNFFHDANRYRAGAMPGGPNANSLIWTDPTQVYIKADGNDTTGLGTREYPYLTFAKAIAVVEEASTTNADGTTTSTPGTIRVMSDLTDGTYNIDLSGKSAIIKTDEVRDSLCTIPSGQYATVTVSFTTDSHSNGGSTNDEDTAFIRVYGNNSPTLTLEEITFSGEGQTANSSDKGSVFRAGAQFTGADAKSGHIILNNGATIQNFTLQRGAISTPGSGGLRPTITMNNGATIRQNTSTPANNSVAGGITAWGAASFTMNGGTIQGNTGGIGGIFINNGTLEITGGSIEGNIGSNSAGAGGIRINRGSGTITDATITGNKGAVGGISTSVPTTITKSDISNNISNVDNANAAGGISVVSNTSTIKGCTITGNQTTSSGWGGGIFIAGGTSVIMEDADDGTGNTVTGNSCAGTDVDKAGGIHASGTLSLSGNVTVTDNSRGDGTASNVALNNASKRITLAGDVTGNVGVSHSNAVSGTVFASGADDTVTAANSLACFSHDANQYRVGATPGAPNANSLIWTDPTQVYIKADGNDTTGLGTREYPYLTFAKAIAVVEEASTTNADGTTTSTPGTIRVMSDLTDGTYNIDLSGKSAIIKTDEVRDSLCTIPSGQYATVTVSFTTDSHSNGGSTNDEDTAFIRVYGNNSPTLTLEEITFSGEGQTANSSDKGSVFRAGAQFTGADAKSGHIILNNGATIQNFTLQRGAISTPGSGGLRPTITMNNGATIRQNTSTPANNSVAGGITAWGAASFTMNGGTIQGNTGGIGGIFINNGTLEITGGSIEGNIGSNSAGAGGIRINRGSGTITDATITGNKGAVGGISTSVPTTITKSDISNNISNVDNANAAGGISVVSNTSTIKGCTITGNQTTSSGWGGGIFIAGGTSVIMEDADDGTGNTVTGNSCAGTDVDKAGGIHASGTLSLSGNVTVTDNSRGDGTASNVALNNASKRITLAGDVTGNVGVSHSDAVSGTVFASGTDASWATNSADSFFHDADTYCVRVLDDTLIWANFVAQIIQDGQTPVKYTTLTDAVNAYISPTGDNNNGYIIQLLDTVTTTFDPTVTINKTVYLDMNRHNIESPVTVEAGGTLYGLDSGTNTYQKALVDANGDATYGEITGGVTGNIQPLTTLTQSGKTMNYVAVKEGDNWSFHRFNVQVGEFTFMIDTAYQCGELWFYPTVQGDEKVMRALAGFGIQATNTVNQDHKETVVGSGDQTALDNNWSANGRYKYRGMLQRLSYTTAENKQRLLSDQFSMGGFLTFTNPNGGTEVRFNGPTNTRSFLEVLKRYYAESADATEKANIDTFITDNGLTSQWTATTWG